MIVRFLFHFICAIGRFFRKCLQLILGRRHEELSTSLGRTEPVTLEHIRIIGEMENDSNRPYQTLASSPKISQAEWNTWGAEDIFRQKQQLNNSLSAEKSEENVDYFSDIAATVKKTPKVRQKGLSISLQWIFRSYLKNVLKTMKYNTIRIIPVVFK